MGGAEKFAEFVDAATRQGIQAGLTETEARSLAAYYGSNSEVVFNLISSKKSIAGKYNIPLVLFAKLLYAIEHEMVASLVDFFFRRTGTLLFDIELVLSTKVAVSGYMAERFNWTKAERDRNESALDGELKAATSPAVG